MTISKGISKVLAVKKESTFGTLAGATGAKQIRRVTSDFNLSKEFYESAEINTYRQVLDARHGARKVDGSINGELSPGTYSDFMQSVVSKDFASVTAITGISATIAAVVGSTFTVTRGTGSWISDGVKVGDVIALSGAGLNAANSANNLLVLSMTALILTVECLSSTSLVAEGPIASVTASVRGKKTLAPLSAHTDDSYTIEEWFSDIAQSEVYVGNKVGSMNVSIPATGMVTINFSFMGKDLGSKGTAQYFTSPAAIGTSGITASVNGALVVNGAVVGLVTSADFSVDRGLAGAVVVGSNSQADIFTDMIRVSGSTSVYFTDAAFRNYFDEETECSLVFAVATSEAKNADVLSFTIPAVKFSGFTKADSASAIIATMPFTALLNQSVAGGLPETTIQIQDTSLV